MGKKKERRPKWKLTRDQARQLQDAWRGAIAIADALHSLTLEELGRDVLRHFPDGWQQWPTAKIRRLLLEVLRIGVASYHPRLERRAGPGRPKPWWFEQVRDDLLARHAALPRNDYNAETYRLARHYRVPAKRIRYHTRDLRWQG